MFNECFRIPVMTPVPEDTILIKVWDWNFMSADELLAVVRHSNVLLHKVSVVEKG